ncbi:hypothetical protein KCMC57_up18770 [Kitasatospora sp. CMC57]|uniref:Uncharacterized protein n=1 Tax=Kitasatospora sp. CMC57 TaxID=3231513 RepID=A0AB33JQK2_9ACTN
MIRTGTPQPMPGWDGGDGNSAYLDKTLRHAPVETALDDRVSLRTLFGLVVPAWIVGTVVAASLGVLGLLIAMAGGEFDSAVNSYGSRYGDSGDGSGFGVFLLMAALPASWVAFLLVLLFQRVIEPIAEWRVLLHERGDSDSAYAEIRRVVLQRGYPLAHQDEWTAAGPGGRDLVKRLVLSQGDCTAHVAVFTYGNGLYLGWQMWRSRRASRLIGQYFRDILGNFTGKADLQWAMARTEQIRAMREAVHAACREGLVVAIEGRQVPLSAGFPDGRIPLVKQAGAPVAGASGATASFPGQQPPRPPVAPPAPSFGPVPPAPPVAPPGEWPGGPAAQG